MEIKMSASHIHTLTVSMKLNSKHTMTCPLGSGEFRFPRISMFFKRKLRETLRFSMFLETKGNKIHCYPRDQSLGYLLCRKAKKQKSAEIPVTTSGHLQLHALIMCNSGQHLVGNSELFPV